MKVLHICNCYMRSKVHVELYRRLDDLGVGQIIYTPERDEFPLETNNFHSNHSEIISSKIIKTYHSVFFHAKINKIYNDVKKKTELEKLSGIHATTLFSDGAVALKIKRNYNIPFFVSVRNTDVNTFIKLPYLWPLLWDLLNEASLIICVTPAIRDRLLNSIALIGKKELVKSKCLVIPNGINDWWIANSIGKHDERTYGVVYVGRFMQNKNVESLINAVVKLRTKIPDIKLNLIGGGGELTDKILHIIKQNTDIIEYHGYLTDKGKISEIMRKNDVFAMASFRETFGLVYIEALSQGLPVLYTKGQGIDGLFEKRIGEGVNPYKIDDISDKLYNLLTDYDDYDILSEKDISRFDWRAISKNYYELYKKYFN